MIDKMVTIINQEVNDIRHNIFRLLKWTKNSKKFYRRPISIKLHSKLIEDFNFNGRYKNGEEFLNHYEISRKRKIDNNSFSKIEAFQIRIENRKILNDIYSQPKISLRFIRIDFKVR